MTGSVDREMIEINNIATRRREYLQSIIDREQKAVGMKENIQNILISHPGFPVNSLSGRLGAYKRRTKTMKRQAIDMGYITNRGWRQL